MEGKSKDSFQCWGCGENHRLRDFLHRRRDPRGLHNLERTTTMEYMVRETHIIYVMLEDQQANHQSTMCKFEGKIAKKSISILIDLRSTHIYITPRIEENYCLVKRKHDKSWLV